MTLDTGMGMDAHPFARGPVLMGIVNVTPDSFSDGGRFIDPKRAIDHAKRLIEEGAAIVDIGGESTRPGAAPVSPAAEIDRIIPVVEGLKGCGAHISVDTRHAATMKAALKAGAGIINDISALMDDPESISVVSPGKTLICLMHRQGEPMTMQKNPHYNNVLQEVFNFLQERISFCASHRIDKSRLLIDPGIGFGKSFDHNMTLIHNMARFQELGVPVLVGLSRKSFIEKICPGTPADRRLPGSLTTALWCLQQGVQVFRVHDVAETRQAFAVFQKIWSRA